MESIITWIRAHPLLVIALTAAFAGQAMGVGVSRALPVLRAVLAPCERYVASLRRRAPWPALLGEPVTRWQHFVGWFDLPFTPPAPIVLAASSLVFLVLGWLLGRLLGVLLVFAALGALGLALASRAARHRRTFVRQLPEGLASLADALRAGYSLPQAIALMARDTRPPLGRVWAALERAYELRLPPKEALERTRAPLGVPEWNVVVESLSAHADFGGNIVPFLEEIATLLRDRQVVDREIQTLTAPGRLSGFLIAGLVPAVILIFWFLSPAYLSILFETRVGQFLLVFVAVLEVLGFLWIRRLVRIEY